MLYILDANTLIDAKRDYYPIDRIPEFWDWLIWQGNQNRIKVPREIYNELTDSLDNEGNKDSLARWVEDKKVKNALLLQEQPKQEYISKIIYQGYANDLTGYELEKIGVDPILVSYSLTDPANRVIVTTEVSRPSKKRANKKIPDICEHFKIRCINNFQLIRECDFKTNSPIF